MKVIESLQVGFGLNVDKQSFSSASAGLDDIKSSAMNLAGVVAGGIGFKDILADINKVSAEMDALNKKARFIGSNPAEIKAMNMVFQHNGGSATQGQEVMELLAQQKRQLNLGQIPEAARYVGVDYLQQANPTEMVKELFSDLREKGFSKEVEKEIILAAGLGEAGYRMYESGSANKQLADADRFIYKNQEGLGEKAEAHEDAKLRTEYVWKKKKDELADYALPMMTDYQTAGATILDHKAMQYSGNMLEDVRDGFIDYFKQKIDSAMSGDVTGLITNFTPYDTIAGRIAGNTAVGSAQPVIEINPVFNISGGGDSEITKNLIQTELGQFAKRLEAKAAQVRDANRTFIEGQGK